MCFSDVKSDSHWKSLVGEGLTEGEVANKGQDTSQDCRKGTEGDQKSSGWTDRHICILVTPVRVADHNHSGLCQTAYLVSLEALPIYQK